jgi:hypothetical protein
MRDLFGPDRLPQMSQEIGAADRGGAERGQVAGFLLAIDQLDAVVSQEAHQIGQCDLGGVRAPREHGFAVEHMADAYPIKAADQFAVQPDFRGVREAGLVQPAIAIDDIVRYPGAGAGAARLGAGAHDGFEGRVEADFPAAVALRSAPALFEAAQRLAQAVGNAEIGGLEHHARIGAPPENRLAVRIPGENALAIGVQQAQRRQIRAGRQQAGRAVFLGHGFGRIGKRRFAVEPGNHQGVPWSGCAALGWLGHAFADVFGMETESLFPVQI